VLQRRLNTINNATQSQPSSTPKELAKNFGKSASNLLKLKLANGTRPSAVVLVFNNGIVWEIPRD
jgi:hypothetical protein